MPKKARTEAWRKKRRQEHLEMKKYRYYIFCEGQQTEPNYFQGFKKCIEENPIYKDMVLIEIEPCQAETMRVIGMAEEYVKKNRLQKGQIWCVYDNASGVSAVLQIARAFITSGKQPERNIIFAFWDGDRKSVV